MRTLATLVVIAGCGSSAPPPERPAQPAPSAIADAAVDAAPDAGIPDEVTNAPPWIFRFNAPGRLETWTLRFANGIGLLIVEAAQGTTRYVGTVSDGSSLTVSVTAGSAKMALDCKREKLAVGAKCGDKATKKIDVLNCYHPDFKTPMSFAAAPGVEFVTADKCTGYRTIER